MFKSIAFVLAGLTLVACSTDNSTPGAGANLKCSSGKNAFDTYGASAFVTVNKAIFTNVTNELTGSNGTSNLGTSFLDIGSANVAATDDDAATFQGKLAAFLVFQYGGPTSIVYTDGKTYVGNDQDMTEAHTGLKITADQYMYFVSNIVVPALMSSGVTTDDVTNCFAPVVTSPTFEDSIVGQ
jgi:hypothetical protein